MMYTVTYQSKDNHKFTATVPAESEEQAKKFTEQLLRKNGYDSYGYSFYCIGYDLP